MWLYIPVNFVIWDLSSLLIVKVTSSSSFETYRDNPMWIWPGPYKHYSLSTSIHILLSMAECRIAYYLNWVEKHTTWDRWTWFFNIISPYRTFERAHAIQTQISSISSWGSFNQRYSSHSLIQSPTVWRFPDEPQLDIELIHASLLKVHPLEAQSSQRLRYWLLLRNRCSDCLPSRLRPRDLSVKSCCDVIQTLCFCHLTNFACPLTIKHKF